MSNNYSLYELLKENSKNLITFGGQLDIPAMIKLLTDNNYCKLPCVAGDVVYKLCNQAIANCKDCPFDSAKGCDCGLISSPDALLTIPICNIYPYEVTDDNIFNVLMYWDTLYFASEEMAENGKKSLYAALEGETAEDRFVNYKMWLTGRKIRFSELMHYTTPDEEFETLLKSGYDEIEYRLNNEPSFVEATEMLLNEDDFKVYRHIPSDRCFCLDRRPPYTFGRVVEVVCFQSIDVGDYQNDESYQLTELVNTLSSMLFVSHYCGGYNHSKKTEILWFRERNKPFHGNGKYDGKTISCPNCDKPILISFNTAKCVHCNWSASDAELDEIMTEETAE